MRRSIISVPKTDASRRDRRDGNTRLLPDQMQPPFAALDVGSPAHLHPAVRHGQRPEYRGVGGEFVQSEGQDVGHTGRQHDVRAADVAALVRGGLRQQFVADKQLEIDPVAFGKGQRRLGPREGVEATQKVRGEILDAVVALARPRRDRSHERQHVAHPVLQLDRSIALAVARPLHFDRVGRLAQAGLGHGQASPKVFDDRSVVHVVTCHKAGPRSDSKTKRKTKCANLLRASVRRRSHARTL